MLCPTLFSLLWSLLGAHAITLTFHRLGSHGSKPFAYERLLPGKHHLHFGESECLTEERVIGSDSLDELTAQSPAPCPDACLKHLVSSNGAVTNASEVKKIFNNLLIKKNNI